MKQLIGGSKAIEQIRRKVRQLSKNDKNVVIVGEPGVGKGVVAEALHAESTSLTRPFVHIDVSTIDELKLRSLVQTILTRHEFVNPSTSEHGNFKLPKGTTLIVANTENTNQVAQKTVKDLLEGLSGSIHGIRLIVLLTGTPRDLVKQKRLSEELRSHLKDWEMIVVPPLRERVDDIPELVEHFVKQAALELNLGEVVIDINALSLLIRKEWDGNVQELKAFVERSLILSEDKETFTLPESLIDEQSELKKMLDQIENGVDFALDKSMELIERRILERVLSKFEFNQSRTARFLKITEDTLRYRMKKLGIEGQTH